MKEGWGLEIYAGSTDGAMKGEEIISLVTFGFFAESSVGLDLEAESRNSVNEFERTLRSFDFDFDLTFVMVVGLSHTEAEEDGDWFGTGSELGSV